MIKTTIVGYGEVSHKLMDTYMDRLEAYLPRYYPGISWYLYDEKNREATTKSFLDYLSKKILIHHPNIIFIRLSSLETDTSVEQFNSLAQYEDNLKTLITSLKHYNNRTGLNGCIPIPIIITPPPVNEAVTGLSRTNNRLKQYTYIIKKVARENNTPLIDLFNALIEQEDYCEKYLTAEGISLNQEGEDLLYDMTFIELIRLINYQGVLKDRDVIDNEE